MRLRTSAAVGAVIALLAAPAWAVACTFQCGAPGAPQTVVPAASQDCHGAATDDRSVDTGMVRGAHDCAQHAQPPPPALRAEASRTTPLAIAALVTGTSAIEPPTAGAIRAHVAAHDLAPPGAAVRFIDALRI